MGNALNEISLLVKRVPRKPRVMKKTPAEALKTLRFLGSAHKLVTTAPSDPRVTKNAPRPPEKSPAHST